MKKQMVYRSDLENGFFAAGIDDGESLAVHRGICPEDETPVVRTFKLHENLRIFRAETVENIGIHHHDQITLMGIFLNDGVELALYFNGHAHGGFDPASTGAIRAGLVHRIS